MSRSPPPGPAGNGAADPSPGDSRGWSMAALFFASVGLTIAIATVFTVGVRQVLASHAVSGLTLFVTAWVATPPVCCWLAFRFRRATARTAAVGCALALAFGGVPYLVGRAWREAERTSKRKAVLFRQITAAMDQYFLETGTETVEYDDLIGPGRHIRYQNSADGEEFRTMFPLHAFTPALSVRLSDGELVSWIQYEVGNDAKPRFAPAEPFYPSGDGPPADGVHRRVLPDGIRLEVAYRDGVPHGPFRAFRSDGRLWGEALYDDGLPVSSTRDQVNRGRSATEVAEIEAQASYVRGLNRYFMGQPAKAVERFTRAIELDPHRPEIFEYRARARLKQGDLIGALADFHRGAAVRRASRP